MIAWNAHHGVLKHRDRAAKNTTIPHTAGTEKEILNDKIIDSLSSSGKAADCNHVILILPA